MSVFPVDPTNTDARPPLPMPVVPQPNTPPARYQVVLPDPESVDTTDPARLGVLESVALLRAGAFTSLALTTALIERTEAEDGPINSFVRRYPDLARSGARAADERLDAGNAPYLCGVPVALKDVFAVAGLPLTASTPVLAGNIAAGDCTAWVRMKAAGMPLLGHTHTHQMAIGSLTEQTGNPWDLRKVPGGSSGGSGAALAARFAAVAYGTDTAGSLRIPAACCNVCSIKPTMGVTSVYGTVPVAWTFDNVGPMARSAADLALTLEVIAGFDPLDTRTGTVIDRPMSFPTAPRPEGLSGTRIGVPEPYEVDLDPGVATSYQAMKDTFRSLGATVIAVPVPAPMRYLDMVIAQGVEIVAYQAQWWPERRADYSRYLRESFELLQAHMPNAVDFTQLQRRRTDRLHQWLAVLTGENLDAILLPTLGTEVVDRPEFGDYGPQQGMAMAPQTNDANYCGLPAVAFPAQLSTVTGLPVGVQLLGAPHTDAHLLQIVVDLQAHTNFHAAVPATK